MRQIIRIFSAIIFLANILFADDERTLKLESVHGAKFGGGTISSIGITNLTGASVKAFRARLSMLNDFDESSEVYSIEFTSAEEFRAKGRQPARRHVIKPGETIYYTVVVKDDGTGLTTFAEMPEDVPVVKERFQLHVEKIVIAEENVTTQPRSEVSDDAKVITERVNTFYAKHQVPTFDKVEAALRKEYPTERFQRERADEDKESEHPDGDPYTLAEGGWDVGAFRVIDVKVEGLRAEASVSRKETNDNVKVSLVKERDKWLIDRVYFSRRSPE